MPVLEVSQRQSLAWNPDSFHFFLWKQGSCSGDERASKGSRAASEGCYFLWPQAHFNPRPWSSQCMWKGWQRPWDGEPNTHDPRKQTHTCPSLHNALHAHACIRHCRLMAEWRELCKATLVCSEESPDSKPTNTPEFTAARRRRSRVRCSALRAC